MKLFNIAFFSFIFVGFVLIIFSGIYFSINNSAKKSKEKLEQKNFCNDIQTKAAGYCEKVLSNKTYIWDLYKIKDCHEISNEKFYHDYNETNDETIKNILSRIYENYQNLKKSDDILEDVAMEYELSDEDEKMSNDFSKKSSKNYQIDEIDSLLKNLPSTILNATFGQFEINLKLLDITKECLNLFFRNPSDCNDNKNSEIINICIFNPFYATNEKFSCDQKSHDIDIFNKILAFNDNSSDRRKIQIENSIIKLINKKCHALSDLESLINPPKETLYMKKQNDSIILKDYVKALYGFCQEKNLLYIDSNGYNNTNFLIFLKKTVEPSNKNITGLFFNIKSYFNTNETNSTNGGDANNSMVAYNIDSYKTLIFNTMDMIRINDWLYKLSEKNNF